MREQVLAVVRMHERAQRILTDGGADGGLVTPPRLRSHHGAPVAEIPHVDAHARDAVESPIVGIRRGTHERQVLVEPPRLDERRPFTLDAARQDLHEPTVARNRA